MTRIRRVTAAVAVVLLLAPARRVGARGDQPRGVAQRQAPALQPRGPDREVRRHDDPGRADAPERVLDRLVRSRSRLAPRRSSRRAAAITPSSRRSRGPAVGSRPARTRCSSSSPRRPRARRTRSPSGRPTPTVDRQLVGPRVIGRAGAVDRGQEQPRRRRRDLGADDRRADRRRARPARRPRSRCSAAGGRRRASARVRRGARSRWPRSLSCSSRCSRPPARRRTRISCTPCRPRAASSTPPRRRSR